MQDEGYSSSDRRLVKTSTPGVYKRGSRYVVVFRDPHGRQRKRSARTLAEARDVKAALRTDVAAKRKGGEHRRAWLDCRLRLLAALAARRGVRPHAGSRVYLNALMHELETAGLLTEEVDVGSVDELLGVLERTSGGTARLIDIPPLELRELRASLAELRAHADSLPSSDELAALYSALRRTADAENKPLLEVSSGVGLAFLTSARKVSATHVVAPYCEDWQPLRDEGFGAYARRVGMPYREAVARNFEPHEPTKTERLLDRFAAWRRDRGR